MEEVVELAIVVLKSGEFKSVPRNYGKIYLSWLRGVHDRCISHQL